MRLSKTVLALGGALLVLPAVAAAQDAPSAAATEEQHPDFDNPMMGDTPCLVLSRYDSGRAPGARNNAQSPARADFENICGRALEISFCFLYAQPVEDEDRACYAGSLRPYERSYAVNPPVPVRIAGPDYYWRYLPVVEK